MANDPKAHPTRSADKPTREPATLPWFSRSYYEALRRLGEVESVLQAATALPAWEDLSPRIRWRLGVAVAGITRDRPARATVVAAATAEARALVEEWLDGDQGATGDPCDELVRRIAARFLHRDLRAARLAGKSDVA